MPNFRIITLKCGFLKGEELTSKLGNKYVSFKGIPYAEPPVGDLRFKPPQSLKSWDGIRDAIKEGNRAPHFDMVTKEFCGDEDCLYLNVYTPEVPEPNKEQFKLKPVMLWIHGGGFAYGHVDADVYGPELLVQHDVVLVTANYRLGILGFLNLELEGASGNMGMKDQVAALRWVKNEIEAFGGDPNNVTIFGNSAGGASVHLHMLSDMSKGLFHKAIAQSGNALCRWSFTTKYKERAFALGKLLGFETNDEKELLNYFLTVPPVKFAKHQDDVMGILDHLKEVDQAFVPSIEKVFLNDTPFMTAHPKCLLESGKFNNSIPFLTGVNSHEGLTAIFNMKKYPEFIKEADSKFHTLLPITEVTDENVKKIRDFYFPNFTISEDAEQLIKFYSDIVFLLPTYESISLHLKCNHNSIYFYRFSYDGKFGWYKRLMAKHRQINLKDIPSGAHHCDELGYLFSNNVLNLQDLTKPSSELTFAQMFSTIWTNFAKTGEPSLPDPSTVWAPITKENLNCLNISESITFGGDSIGKRINIWKDIGMSTSLDN